MTHHALPATVLFVAAALVSPLAAAAETGNFLIAGLAYARVEDPDGGDRAPMLRFGIGRRWNAFGAELLLMRSGEIERRIDRRSTDGPLASVALDVSALMLGGNLRLPLADRWHLSARGGLLAWKIDGAVEYCGGGLGGSYGCSQRGYGPQGTDYYVGVGAGFDVDARLGVELAIEQLHIGVVDDRSDGGAFDLRQVGLNAQWRF